MKIKSLPRAVQSSLAAAAANITAEKLCQLRHSGVDSMNSS